MMPAGRKVRRITSMFRARDVARIIRVYLDRASRRRYVVNPRSPNRDADDFLREFDLDSEELELAVKQDVRLYADASQQPEQHRK